MRFHVTEVGAGPLVLLLHGFPEFWWAWREQLPVLAAAGFRAAALDLRGYGASDKPPRGYDPTTLARDVSGVVRALGERSAVLVGHGTGGSVAWTVAAFHPEVVRRLVVVSAPHPLLARSSARDPAQARALAPLLGFQRPFVPERQLTRDGHLVHRLLDAWSGPAGVAGADRYAEAMLVPGVAHCSMEYFRWAVRSLARPDGLRYAAAVGSPTRVPTLQLHGELDGLWRPQAAAGSGRYVGAPYRWRVLPGVGHFPHEEDPAAFDSAVLDWLTDPEPDR